MFPKAVDRVIAEYANPMPCIRGYRELRDLQWIIWTFVGEYEDCRGCLADIMGNILFGKLMYDPPCEMDVIRDEIAIFGSVGLTGSDILHARRISR